MLCFLASQRGCAGSHDGSTVLNHQSSLALLQILAWMSGGTGRLVGQDHLSVYSVRISDMDFSSKDAYSQHSRVCVGRLS